jgi:hypothetical protein
MTLLGLDQFNLKGIIKELLCKDKPRGWRPGPPGLGCPAPGAILYNLRGILIKPLMN